MTATAFTCEAPTDAQLRYLAGLCAERGIDPLPVVYSKDDASACIGAILRREYVPAAWAPPSAALAHDDADFYGLDCDAEDVPF